MTIQSSMLHPWSLGRSAVLAFALALGAVSLPATPAQARDEFENGFEDQIGRLLAFEAYRVGRVILGGHAPYGGHRGDYYDYGRPRHYRYSPPPRFYRPKHVHHHHRYIDRDCDDDVEYRYEVRRSRRGEVVKERYRSRGDRDRDDRYDRDGYWRY